MKHVARKRFGQHFLNDPSVIDAIVRGIAPCAGEAMVEIGPGLAALTQPLLERLGRLTVIELDRDLAARLRQTARLDVIEADVLRVDFTALGRRLLQADAPPGPGSGLSFADACHGVSGANAVAGASAAQQPGAGDPPGGLRIVGNLPYNISTPILFHLLEHVAVIRDQHFMLQKEVVDRMVATPATADYSRLSVMLQWRYAMDNLLHVPPESFDPPPRVNSAIVRMVPLAEPPAVHLALYGELVQTAFSQRRKILRNTLGKWLEARDFAGRFDLQRRAEEVPVAEYVALTQAIQPKSGSYPDAGSGFRGFRGFGGPMTGAMRSLM